MARIAITSIPYTGHLTPLFGLTEELVRRGHKVSFLSTADRAARVRELGATAVVYPSPMAEQAPAADRDEDLSVVLPRLLREAKAALPVLNADLGADPPDCVLVDVVAWGGAMFAHQHGIPEIQGWPVFAANEVFSLESRYEQSLGDLASLEVFYHDLGDLARESGSDSADYLFAASARNIVFIPREFQYAGETFDERYAFVGPCLPNQDPPRPADDRPLVLVSMGTAHDRGAEFFRACATALADLPTAVLMLTGGCVDLAELRDLPANVTVRERVEQFALLGRTEAFVTHGGMNSVLEALHQAVPMVVLPDRVEQIANADRIVELGVGVRIAGVEELATSVRRVSTDARIRARLAELRTAVRSSGGAAAAADAVERWLRTG